MKPENSYLGVGLYTIPEAARLLRTPAQKLRRWAQGYTFARDRQSPPILQRQHPEMRDAGVLTFLDLIELYLVGRFREAGVSMHTIRENAERARGRFHTKHPFATKQFHISGRDLIHQSIHKEADRADSRVYEDIRKSQLVLGEVAECFFKNLGYQDDLARYYWPLSRSRDIVLDPARSFGKPIDARSGVPTSALFAMFQAGETPDAIARWYDVGLDAVHSAVEYESSLAKAA